jgi:integrase/recombinase XerD
MGKEKVDVKLTGVAIDFLDYLHTIKNASDGTIDKYESNMREFYNYLMINNKKKEVTNRLLKQLELSDLYRYLKYTEKELKNSPATRARKVAFLKSYFKYLYKKAKVISDNIAEELETPKITKKNPIVMSLQQSETLLETVQEDKDSQNYYRDKCIITLFLHCGLRISELCNIKIKDIGEDKLTVLGKGDKERDIYLNNECKNAINEYLQNRKDDKATNEDKEYLFLSKWQKPINTNTVRQMVENTFKDANLTDKKYTPHKIRSTYATLMNQAGYNIKQIAKSMGHVSIQTTDRYISVNDEELKDMAMNNPLLNKVEKGEW